MQSVVLVINPGSTSTKFAVFHGDRCIFDQTLNHSAEELSHFATIASQYEFRESAIQEALKARNFDMSSLNAVVGRGGLLHPIPGGIYRIDRKSVV